MMNYILKPSLEHIALVKITTALWNQKDIKTLIVEFSLPLLDVEECQQWQKIEIKVIDKVLKLPLPGHLQEKILGLVKPIGIQIRKWMELHSLEGSYIDVNPPSEFSWTPYGTIDKKKTAELIIKNDNIDLTKRFRLAGYYCLETDTIELCPKIPKNCLESFYDAENPAFLMCFLRLLLKVSVRKVSGIRNNERLLISDGFYAAASCYRTKRAAEYFFEKLTANEKEESIVNIAKNIAKTRVRFHTNVDCTEVLCFLLSQMNEEQQIEVFKEQCYPVLKCLLDWPWQDFFLETAKRVWNFFCEDYFEILLNEIISKAEDGYKDFNYGKIFQEFWKQSPDLHKRYLTNKLSVVGILFNLRKIKDKNNIKMIIQDASLKARKKIIFSQPAQYILDDMIKCEEWDLLKFVVQACISETKEIGQLKTVYRNQAKQRHLRYELLNEDKRLDEFFHILSDLECSFNKGKCIKESNSCPAKKPKQTL